MRVTELCAPARRSKHRLLESCAIAAGLAALASAGPAMAQGVAGTGQLVSGNATISPPAAGAPPNTTNVTTTTSQTIINWTPTDTAATGGAIDFLPEGNTLNFVGNGQYTVLNRFIDGGGGALSRQIALNGTVNSYDGSTSGPRGGNIWFYNAGGILIGAAGVINVGSLVLTANDIDTTGGLFDPSTGSIRFRGAPASLAPITIDGTINAGNPLDPGSSYVAMVAPRIVQAGTIDVDGSTALVAAEQADIRINNGLFDINVLIGAEGGTVITHTGTTGGPAHQQGDSDQSRIYMVAVPKNVAVGMLVSGQVGYQDAMSPQIDPDGSVVLSAGYNITAGAIDTVPVNATAANMQLSDVIFGSDIFAHASGTMTGVSQSLIPPPGQSVLPPNLGSIIVLGNGTFIGDERATFIANAGQAIGATGDFNVVANGANGVPGIADVTVNAGQLVVQGTMTVAADGPVLPDGTSAGGNASLTINTGSAQFGTLAVTANGAGGIGAGGNGGNGAGGTAGVSIGDGGLLSVGNMTVQAAGTGGGLFIGQTGLEAVDAGGDGLGGTATLTIDTGASLIAGGGVSVDASGNGQTGTGQSGTGTGGVARLEILGDGSSYSAEATVIGAYGFGGSTISNPNVGTIFSALGGNGIGGSATLLVGADAASSIALGDTDVTAGAFGGNSGGSENVSGGDAAGGSATVTITNGVSAGFANLFVSAEAESGGGASPSGLTGSSGDATGGDVVVLVNGGATLDATGQLSLSADANVASSENLGSATGGNIVLSAMEGAAIDVGNPIYASANAGNDSFTVVASAGSGTGGTVNFIADGGTISADDFQIAVRGAVANVSGANGPARGGTIALTSSNGGLFAATNDGTSYLDASATTGVSATGSNATAGDILVAASAGVINFGDGVELVANGVSGGAANPGPILPLGMGGNIVIQLDADASNSSALSFGELFASTEGSTRVDVESAPGIPGDTAGNGVGGSTSFNIDGGTVTGGTVGLTADGFGGGSGTDSATGQGGTATFTLNNGDVSIGDMTVAADGFGGSAQGVSGQGIGGIATINFIDGTITAADIIASATGEGGFGLTGSDEDPANIVPGGAGGTGTGGDATINVDGTAAVNASIIAAYASGSGGQGGDFVNMFSFSGTPGTPGDGGAGNGGTAIINVVRGTVTSSNVIADASAIGGDGGDSFFSSSSGGATGVGVGGRGGSALGGRATIELMQPIEPGAIVSATSRGIGGDGGFHNVGGDGGNGFGGIAQAIIDDFEAGPLAFTLDSRGQGGSGSNGADGAGGNGGEGIGGNSQVIADGPNAYVTVTQSNFMMTGSGGNGGNAGLQFGSSPSVSPAGGNGGNGVGGALQIIGTAGGTVALPAPTSGNILLESAGFGGRGGNGADGGFSNGSGGGDGGNGGVGTGGNILLLGDGGTVTTDGSAIDIDAYGVSGTAGTGGNGTGTGASGANGFMFANEGGRVTIEAVASPIGNPGFVGLGDTTIDVSGAFAGRIELRTGNGGAIEVSNLDAQAFGFANPTNNNSNEAAAGIFLGTARGVITSFGSVSLATGGSVGVYAESNGRVDIGGDLLIQADDQIDIRHDMREGAEATVEAGGEFTAIAGTSISGAANSLLVAGGAMTLEANGPMGTIAVDALDAADIFMTSTGDASVEHAEADNDFTANVGSFRTGLNSIVTGGNIIVSSPGLVDLGNSTAGGFVSVDGESIIFNSIDANDFVGLSATGTLAGAEGIDGGSIVAGSDISLFGNSVTVANISGAASLFAVGSGGAVAIDQADVAGLISVSALGDVTGSYFAGGDIFLNSNANIDASVNAAGGFPDPQNGDSPLAGNALVDAAGDVVLTDSITAGMLGINAGTSATLTNASAGEDILVLAGTTATLTDVTAGDDLGVRADGDITVTNATADASGPDGFALFFARGSGFTIGQGEGSSSTDGADIILASTSGAIDATDVVAGDDIFLNAATSIAVDGATTLGIGLNGGDSSMRTQAGATTLANLDAFSDIEVNSGGLVTVTAPVMAGRNISITSIDDISGGSTEALGDVYLASSDGTIIIDSLLAGGTVDASASAIDIGSGGALTFSNLVAISGDAVVQAGSLNILNADVANDAQFSATGGSLTLGDVTAGNSLEATAFTSMSIGGVITGRTISLASADIDIAPSARVGTSGTTESLSVANNNSDVQTFVGGTGSRNGYHLDAAELTRLFGNDIGVFAPAVQDAGGGSVGSAAPPDVIVDGFTVAGGAAGSNLGATGSMTIRTAGKMRVIGDVLLTGLSSNNSLNLFAADALEVILGQGTVRLVNGATPAGQLNLDSADIIVATSSAIAAAGTATSTAAIDARLAQNDGITRDEGALFAGGINAAVSGGFYVQNSGAGTDFAQRRGLTFGAQGLNVDSSTSTARIVVNGVQLGSAGQVTGIDLIPVLTINGSSPSAGSFDPRSTLNGCLIVNPAACSGNAPGPRPTDFESNFPVQDVIEETSEPDDDGDGIVLSAPLITMRDLDPLTGEPLLDDPVTGAGNDDLWTPPAE